MSKIATAETGMAAAFKSAGMSQKDWRLMSAAWTFLKDGGTVERAHALVDKAAKKLPGEGQTACAEDGHLAVANSRQPDGDAAGLVQQAENGQIPIAAAPPARSETLVSIQQAYRGDDGQFKPQPTRRPTAVELRIAGSIARDGAVTIMDSIKIRDGRSIGNIRLGELERLRTTNVMEAALFRLIQKHAVGDSSTYVRDAMKTADLQRCLQQAAEVADAS